MCGGGGGGVGGTVKRESRKLERQGKRDAGSFVRDAKRSLEKGSLGKKAVEGFGKAIGVEAPEDPIGDLIESTKGKDTTPPPERAPGPPSEEEAKRLAEDERRKRLRQKGLTSTIFTSPLGRSEKPTTAPRTLLGG